MDIDFFSLHFGPKFQKQVRDFCLNDAKYTTTAGSAGVKLLLARQYLDLQNPLCREGQQFARGYVGSAGDARQRAYI